MRPCKTSSSLNLSSASSPSPSSSISSAMDRALASKRGSSFITRATQSSARRSLSCSTSSPQYLESSSLRRLFLSSTKASFSILCSSSLHMFGYVPMTSSISSMSIVSYTMSKSISRMLSLSSSQDLKASLSACSSLPVVSDSSSLASSFSLTSKSSFSRESSTCASCLAFSASTFLAADTEPLLFFPFESVLARLSTLGSSTSFSCTAIRSLRLSISPVIVDISAPTLASTSLHFSSSTASVSSLSSRSSLSNCWLSS
mmetsp:Transcript_478/g.1020  ORF Transcript_478/g.1020 Transcript_478/m.1020 type:complete len:259 (+) Transcript_478:494-1270(+)